MVMTPWGYDVDAGELPPIISPEELSALTGGRFGADTVGVTSVLDAVSAAVRNACGWHVAPALDVVEATQGPGRVLRLHTLLLRSVASVTERGQELGEGQFEASRAGLLRRLCWREWPGGFGSVVVAYRSGIPTEMAPDLAAVVAQMASNALAAPAGVRSEQAGDVSVTYNTTASGVSGGVRLLDSDLAMLAPYALEGSWS